MKSILKTNKHKKFLNQTEWFNSLNTHFVITTIKINRKMIGILTINTGEKFKTITIKHRTESKTTNHITF